MSVAIQAETTTAIVYTNGVFTTKEDARDNLFYGLRPQVKRRFSSDEYSQVEFKLAYNKTERKILDLWEAAKQEVVISVSSFFRFLSGLSPLPDTLQESYVDLAISFDELSLSNADVQNHLKIYKSLISEGKNIVLVAHSQGNYFASLSYNNLSNEEQNYMGIVSVANVGGFPADGRLIYTTSSGDLVTAATFVLNQSLPANTINPFSLDEPTGHYFVESYLKKGNPSQTKILNDIWATFWNIPQPPLPPNIINGSFYGKVVFVSESGTSAPSGIKAGDLLKGEFSYDTSIAEKQTTSQSDFAAYRFNPGKLKFTINGLSWECEALNVGIYDPPGGGDLFSMQCLKSIIHGRDNILSFPNGLDDFQAIYTNIGSISQDLLSGLSIPSDLSDFKLSSDTYMNGDIQTSNSTFQQQWDISFEINLNTLRIGN